ncbi:OsmC family protein [Georgenia thermotolerans]|uniref:OsmC family peroxiredoxin n=1 Tax=Georgenia thermotolerans TaxID=527326 RepID=A0A7J5USP1_9MICO|nr:OsmC family protein [Georgenia thermotolerans]KAE8765475.1 hypothetical protein GB883_03535 [Georgenia thermotolerans]
MTATLTHLHDETSRRRPVAVDGVWQGGLHTRVTARRFALQIDEPTTAGGQDNGADPVEHLLAALTGGVTVDIHTVARELGIRIGAVDIHADGAVDVRGPGVATDAGSRLERVSLHVLLTTPAPAATVKELRAAVGARSLVLNLLRDAGVRVAETWEAVPA